MSNEADNDIPMYVLVKWGRGDSDSEPTHYYGYDKTKFIDLWMTYDIFRKYGVPFTYEKTKILYDYFRLHLDIEILHIADMIELNKIDEL